MKKRILISAYGCEPNRGSEAGVGWNWVLKLAEENELYVITRKNNREKIEQALPENLKDNIHFIYYDTGKLLLKLKKKEKGLYFYYFFWQRGIVSVAKELIKKHKFDYIMHLSFGSFWMPTFLSNLGVPFIWGPLGGGEVVPKCYLRELPPKQRLVQSLRYLLIKFSFLNPFIAVPSKNAVSILCRTENNQLVVPKKYRYKTDVILETAIEEEAFEYEKIHNADKAVQFIATGRLVASKNIIMAVQAFNNVVKKYPKATFRIIGDGPEKAKIKKYIEANNLQGKVELVGRIERNEVFKMLQEADVYLFPSFLEGGGPWSLMEAMAVGLPIVCFNCTGIKVITDDECAVRILPTGYEENRIDFEKEMLKLIENPELRKKMGLSAKKRIKEKFLWDYKAVYFEKLMAELDSKSACEE